jgi:hypothetical protein
MRGLSFQAVGAIAPSDPNRVDIACFVGLVARRTPTPKEWDADPVRTWLDERGWSGSQGRPAGELMDLLDVPAPIESWDDFDRRYAWDARPLDLDGTFTATSYLGAAVRAFFVQGGRRCYVVRVGDPPPLVAPKATRRALIDKLLPTGAATPSPVDRTSWHGIGHLFGLPDVSFLSLPDLPDLVALDRGRPSVDPPPAAPFLEQFVECSTGEQPEPADRLARKFAAPRCDQEAYGVWVEAVQRAALLVSRAAREVMLLAAIPLPEAGLISTSATRAPMERDLLTFMREQGWLNPLSSPTPSSRGLATAFLQLAFPWLKTRASDSLPEKLENPEGVLSGLLARNALLRGTYSSAAPLPIPGVYDVEPKLPSLGGDDVVEDHVSLFGPTVSGLRLIGDSTTSDDVSYRSAGVSRLVAAIVRAARRLGEHVTFEPSNPRLWRHIVNVLSDVLTDLWNAGALDGATPGAAFNVRCDATTTTQQDLDAGRVICEVSFTAAAAIDRINVVLVMAEGGRVSLAHQEAAA